MRSRSVSRLIADARRHRTPDAVGTHQLDQHALAQAAVGDAQALARKRAPDRLQDRAAGQHQVGALGADAGIGGAILVAHAHQPLDHAGHLDLAHPAAIDAATIVARQVEMNAGDGRHRTRGAEQMQAVEIIAVLGGEAVEVLGDLLDHGVE